MKKKKSGLINVFNSIVNKGQERSVKAKKNIIASFFIKGLSIAISLLIVPITIDYINPSRYGIWLTLSSIVGWFSFFDIGLTQGLRNKFSEAKTKGQHELAQIYVSTTYAILAIIFSFVWIIFILANNYLNWATILNISEEMAPEISLLAVIVFSYFCLQFVLKVISTLVIADQQPAKSSLIDVLGQVVSLVFILTLVKTTEGSLVKLGLALCISPLIVLLSANVFFFRRGFKKYRPKISKIKFTYAKGLFNLGVIFFIIQIAGIIQFQSANIIIARNFGTSEVTSYTIVYKFFGIIHMVFLIFVTPFWSASTEAYLKKDYEWIKKGIKKYNQLNVLMFVLSIVMLIFSSRIYDLWLGEGKVFISFNLSFWGFVFFNVGMFGSKYVNFLNGINALRLQFLTSILSPIIYIVIAMTLIKYFKLGVSSLFIAAVLANLNAFLIAPIQYYQIIIKKKKGIWTK